MKRALLLLLVLLIAGCGTGSGAGPSDPAQIAPPNTLAYASFQIKPQGDAKAGFDAAFGKLLGANPEDKLGEAFTEHASTSGRLDYESDVKPWLGDTLSVVVTRVGRRDGDFALLAASTDDDKARAAVEKDAGAGARKETYRDLTYTVLSDGTANGVVDHFLVAGTEPAFKAVVDASRDGKSLADSDQWKQTVGDRGSGKVGLAYVDLKGMLQSFAADLPGLQRVAGPLLLGTLPLHPFVATLDAQSDALITDVSSPGTKADRRGPAAASSPLIESLPADSLFAMALPKVGAALEQFTAALQANPLLGTQVARVAAQMRAATGLKLSDIVAAIGDLGFFVRATSPRTAGGAFVVESDDPVTITGAAKPLVMKLPPRVARKVRMRNNDRVAVIAYGAAAMRAAIKPEGRLGDLPAFDKAAALLGERPTLFLNFQSALALAARSPHHRNDAHFRKALPHLRHVDYVAAGARRDSGLDVIRAVIGLR